MGFQVVTSLPKISFASNWPLKQTSSAQFLLPGMGAYIDNVVDSVVQQIRAAQVPGMRIGSIEELVEISGHTRSIRIKQTDREVHHAVADILMRRQGDDLYIKIQPQARSMTKWLKRIVLTTLFLVGVGLLYTGFFHLFEVRESFVQDYVAKKWAGAPKETVDWQRSSHMQLSLLAMIRKDPKLALLNLGGPPALMAGAIGGVLALLPKSWLTVVCRLVGWPSVDEFESLIAGHVAWVEGVIGSVLTYRFGVREDQRVKLGN